jgi:hypothetical protein
MSSDHFSISDIPWRRLEETLPEGIPVIEVAEGDYGYFTEKKVARTFHFLNRRDPAIPKIIWEKSEVPCLDDLREQVKSSEGSLYVWTPCSPNGVPAELCPALTRPFFEKRLREVRSGLKVSAFNCLIFFGLSLLAFGSAWHGSSLYFFMISFGLLPLLGHLIELHARNRRPLYCARKDRENWQFLHWVQLQAPRVTYILCGGLLILGGLQFFYTGIDTSVELAGLDTVAVTAGEFWRLITGPLLHANYIHIAFNLLALWL